jgi:putative membrane protein
MITLGGLVATLVVAALHVVFMVLESILWTKPTGRRIFAQSREDAETTKVLAQNQGVYNGALAGLLVWAALSGLTSTVAALLIFVVVVGVFGAITAKPTILFLQALPAGIALALVLLGV